MITIRRRDLKLTLSLGFAVLVGLGVWLSIVLLSQLEQMKAVTAPAVQSLGDRWGPLTGIMLDDAAARAEADYAAARLWVWFCISANAAGAVLLGLWIKAAMVAPPAQVRRKAGAATLTVAGNGLIVRAIERSAQSGAGLAMRGEPDAARALPAPRTAGAGDAAARLARLSRIIDAVAFQTTILAVNAAVEAARAGQAPPRR
ncbi:methyl-accepting chemotaxis protein [Massilia sp. CCM 9210]|uniref:methyl-accepting chemotaxis protein n=1 Tax=Massilia scottii TaxID=3057166 RepID=UPI0027969D9C|nr:methyl-accepting chemotaxis protein [Massilia sp. CCM 9210]MDQ1812268.1 methyl-accepting chemotaxis protein [Massilia sp. CCM 9210]